MTIQEAHEFLNFWIGKYIGAFYTPEQLDTLIDRGQMSYFEDLLPKYGTSQRIRDALSPFKSYYDFTTGSTPLGVITIPTSKNMIHFLDGYVTITDPNLPFPIHEIVFPNEDELTIKLRSQIDPVTASNPVGEWVGGNVIQLWPKTPNSGRLNFYRKPNPPVFAYSLVSGRVVVYNSGSSQSLEWKPQDHLPILMKALSHVGVNLKEKELAEFAEIKQQENFQNVNKI